MDKIDNVVVEGWARYPENESVKVKVEAVVDGAVVASTLANVARPDVARAGGGDGRCGFVLRFDPPLSDPSVGELRLTAGEVQTTASLTREPRDEIEGFVDFLDSFVVRGWAWRSGQPDTALDIEVTHRGEVIARGRADLQRADLRRSGRGNGRYGFQIGFSRGWDGPERPVVRASSGTSSLVLHESAPARQVARPGPAGGKAPMTRATPVDAETIAAVTAAFDAEFYRSFFPRDGVPGDAVVHYLTTGWAEGRDPAPWFSTRRYLSMHDDVREAGVNPFYHYLIRGKAENRAIASAAGDATRAPVQKAPIASVPAGHHVDAGEVAVLRQGMDEEYYLSCFPKGEEPGDATLHYATVGWREGRDPTRWFSTRHYLATQADVRAAGMNPFYHYLVAGKNELRSMPSRGGGTNGSVYKAHVAATSPGPHFEEFDPSIGASRTPQVKVLAYYLPQFHAIPENDRFWGKGFTEWRNLPRGEPRFVGHVQPKIPRDLGPYDLLAGDAMHRQIDLARAAGLHGFCFYHYWFDGKRVLERPIERLLADPTLDFPFMLMWANENWTRTWDGAEREVLLKQSYHEADDEPFVDDLARHFRDPRYIRIGDRPFFGIYRAGHIPGPRERIARWRRLLRERHGLDPLIYMAQTFGDNDPRVYGLDGAIEFPPHKVLNFSPDRKSEVDLLDEGFSGSIPFYDDVVAAATRDPVPAFPLVRTVFPAWDNDARRPGRGTIVAGSTPSRFRDWLSWAVGQALEHPVEGEPFVCVNAWNEWAEGAYLEPDVHFGAAYLNMLARVVFETASDRAARKVPVLLVGHDATRFGAQILLGEIGKVLVRQFGFEVAYILGAESWKPGAPAPMLETYRSLGAVDVVENSEATLGRALEFWTRRGARGAIANTTVSGWMVPHLKAKGLRAVSLIHELPRLIQTYGLTDRARTIAGSADLVVFAADFVRRSFLDLSGPTAGETEVLPQGLYKAEVGSTGILRDEARQRLGIASSDKLVINVGFSDMRKGIDRFARIATAMCDADPDLRFIWIGDDSGPPREQAFSGIAGGHLAERIVVTGHRDDVADFYAAADVFLLTSREDPFPSVVLEALAAGLPVVGFAGTGGCDDLIAQFGTLVPNDDLDAAQAAVAAFLAEPARQRKQAASARREAVLASYRFDAYCFELMRRLDPALARISVIVPNYNYARYIGERLETVFAQSHPVFEVIVLDDASTDDSLAAIRKAADTAQRTVQIVANDRNSGSVFAQWRKGLELARGDYVWIAEADDLARPGFLSTVVTRMSAAGSAIGFSDSWQIDESDARTGDSYRAYMNTTGAGAFDDSFDMAGADFAARMLAVKNVILNVSGVVFRKDALVAAVEAVGEKLNTFKVAGDWRLYAEICLAGGGVTYVAEPLNGHRRHATSVTHALKIDRHIQEIRDVQTLIGSRVSLDEATKAFQRRHVREARAHLNALAKQAPGES